jgi:hypothetical protein
VQQAIDGKHPRKDPQAKDWAGHIVADVLGLDAGQDKARIKSLIETWIRSEAFRLVMVKGPKRDERPCLEVGEWATA